MDTAVIGIMTAFLGTAYAVCVWFTSPARALVSLAMGLVFSLAAGLIGEWLSRRSAARKAI